jgi:hypothetical protein
MIRLAFLLVLSLLVLGSAGAQGNVTGNHGSWGPDFEVIIKCVDSLDLGTNYIPFYEVQTHKAGIATTFARFRANGATFSPPSGNQYLGSCPGSSGGGGDVSVTDSLRDYEILQLCDLGAGETSTTPFIRILMRSYKPSTGAGSTVILANINLSGASYTPTGTVINGPCANTATGLYTHNSLTNTTANYTGSWESWSITNTGFASGQVNVASGGNVEILPGETISCRTYFDEISKKTIPCASINVDVTGTSAKVILRKK